MNITLALALLSFFTRNSPPNSFLQSLLNQDSIVAEINLSSPNFVWAFIVDSSAKSQGDQFGYQVVGLRIV